MNRKNPLLTNTKPKTLFDHVNHIMVGKDPQYYNNLSEEDRKSWSNWMINKVLSMTPEYCDIINETQRYLSLDPSLYYKVLIDIIPKRKVFSKYIKSSRKIDISQEDLDLLSKYFMISTREIKEYSEYFTEEFINEVKKQYGTE